MSRTRDNGGDVARASGVVRVLWLVLGLNLLVATAKLVYGMASGSVGMTADGFHSMFDGTSNVIGLVGIYIASRPADRGHPYGHVKYETFASVAIGAMLLLAAWRVGSGALAEFTNGATPPRVDAGSFAVMLGTLAVNVGTSTYERRVGRRLRSDLLLADARHTASDILVSLGVVAGLMLVRLGYPQADPLVGIFVSGAIVFAAWGVFRQANETLSDQARLSSAEVCEVVAQVPGALGCHSVRTRGTAAAVYVDLHVQVDPKVSVADGHRIAEEVEAAVIARLPTVADVIAHLEPMDDYQAAKTAEEERETTP